MKFKIKKGDKVKVLAGKDRGKVGVVEIILTAKKRVKIEGVNVVKKHQKAKRSGEKGQLISLSMPIDISKVQLICPKCSKPSRVGRVMDGDKKFRVCKKCNAKFE
ncbi:MAG: 50S ribosomal protein L24 [Candidatus Moranbacteria bacterium]|nr:50S ribosomal protein L24 [Candidatus Moranbacteria bacterium]